MNDCCKWLLAALAWQASSIAQADVLVVPVTDESSEEGTALADLQLHVEHALGATGGDVLRGRSAATALALSIREPSEPITDHRVEAFRAAAKAAHEGLDEHSDPRLVLSHFIDVREALLAAPEVWNVPANRREIHGACLGAVASIARAADTNEGAVRVAAWCMAMLDQRLSDQLAPPKLMPIYRAAAKERDEQTGSLSVAAPDNCRLYANGQLLAVHGPFFRDQSYSVLARCADGQSKVHLLRPSFEETDVEIDLELDRALQLTESGPRLQHQRDDARDVENAARLAALVPGAVVLAMWERGDGFALQRVPGGDRSLLARNYSEDELRSAVTRAMATRSRVKKEK